MSAAKNWNDLRPAHRLEVIEKISKLTGKSFGSSNKDLKFEKVSKVLRDEIENFYGKTTKWTPATIEKTALQIIEDKFGVEPSEVAKDSDIVNDFGFDSLDVVEFVMELERVFDISIPDEHIENGEFKVFGKMLDYLNKEICDIKPTPEIVTEEVDESTVSNELDLVISFDDTGSMSSVRKQVRNHVNSLVKQLFNDIPNLRVGIIIHNDYCDMPRHCFTLDLTTDKSKIERFVNQDSPCGGGDAPECYELALHEASKMTWSSRRKALIMIGDEVPHQVGYRYGSHTNKLDWREEAHTLSEMGVQIYGVQALGRRSSTMFYDTISRMSGGIKLDLSQFQHISTYINAIAYHQSGQLDAYQSSDPAFSTNLALKNMFNRLKGGTGSLSSEKIEVLSKFQVMSVETDGETTIRDFVEMNGCTFRKGKGYYQLIERTSGGKANSEIIQADKEVLFVDKLTGEAITDTMWCRKQLGVPYGTKGTVRPLSLGDVMSKYDVFVQSNSYTRKLDTGTRFLYELDHL
jgi:acyl carrier protein